MPASHPASLIAESTIEEVDGEINALLKRKKLLIMKMIVLIVRIIKYIHNRRD